MFFSVVIPCVNYKNLIKVSKILNSQTVKNFEIVLIIYEYKNNCEIIDKLLNKHFSSNFNIKLINTNELNVSKARNLGIKNSTGLWICFLDDDDIWFKQKLEIIHNYIKINKECNFLFHDVNISKKNKIVNTQSKRVNHYIKLKKNAVINFNQFKHHNFVITSSVAINKKLLIENSFDESLKIAEDWDLWLRLTKNYKLHYLHTLLGEYTINPYSLTSDLVKYEKNNLNFFYKHKNIYSEKEFKNSIKTMYFLIFLSLLKEKKFNYSYILKCIKIINIDILNKVIRFVINKINFTFFIRN